MNAVLKFLHHKFLDDGRHWYPLLSVFYLTYECKFRCPYCSDGFGRPYHTLDNATLSSVEAIAILQRIRRYCDRIVITGGEPTLHPGFDAILEAIPDLRFAEVVLTTTGEDLTKHLPVISRCVTSLVFSLDTLDNEKADSWSGGGPGTLHKVLESIEAARACGGADFDIHISSVVTPGNILDLYEVYQYAEERGFQFAASPQLVGVKAHSSLKGNAVYRCFFDYLIGKKQRGGRVFGTTLYLQYMRDLKSFICHPFTMLVVSPSGEVFYPCLERGRPAGHLLDYESLHDLRRRGREQFGPPPRCENQCQSPCALGFALAIDYPPSLLVEGCTAFFGGVRKALSLHH